MPSRIVNRPVQRMLKVLLGLALLLGASPASAGGDIANTVELTRRFGKFACETCIGDTITEVEPGRTFMFAMYSAFDCGTCDGHTTTTVVEFPDSVIPRVDAYPAPYVQVVGSTVVIQQADHAGIFIVLQFSVKPEADLPPTATSITMKTTITVVPPAAAPLVRMYEDVLPIARDVDLVASATAAPTEVQLTDPEAVITVTVTLQNPGTAALTHAAPAEDPVPSVPDAVERTAGPTPPSVDLAPGASGTVTYTYKPKKAGNVKFAFARFLAESPSGVVEAGPTETNEVAIKDDVTVELVLEPSALTTDSWETSGGKIVAKVTDSRGEPAVGYTVRLKIPQYFLGPTDFEPRLLICTTDGQTVYPPGVNPIALDAALVTTNGSGEATFQLWVGTQRRSAELLIVADVIDETGDLLATDSGTFGLAESAGSLAPIPLLNGLREQQRNQLPEAQRQDSAGITGRAGTLEVLQSLVRWLSAERERGFIQLQGIDFVPITSQDQANAGVLFFARGDLQAVLAHLQGTPGASAVVLQIELSQLDPLLRREVLWLGPLMALQTWEATKPLNTLGIEDEGKPIRGPAVAATGLFADSPYAYLGYPYPTTVSAAAGGYGGGCVPSMKGIGAELHSPITLLVKNTQGQAVGFDASGAYVNEVPGAVYDGGEPSRYLLPPGSYQADVLGTDKGPATLVLSAPGATSTVTLKAKPGKTGTLTFDDTLVGAAGSFNKKKLKITNGVPITVTGVKKKVKVRSGDPLTLTVKNLFGNGVAGASVHATGKDFDAETLTGADGVATMPLAVTKQTKRLTVTIDGAGVEPKTLKLKVKLLK